MIIPVLQFLLAGYRSLREAIRIIKIHVLCGKPSQEEMRVVPEDYRVKALKKRLERLMVRKCILLFGVLAAISITQTLWFAVSQRIAVVWNVNRNELYACDESIGHGEVKD